MPLSIAVVPLDNRPVNTRLIRDLATIGGVSVSLPPAEMVGGSGQREPHDGLTAWMHRAADDSDAMIVNINQLAFGGYVASRRFSAALEQLLPRLGVLREIRTAHPGLPLLGFVTLMRTKDVNDGSVEPAYWSSYGEAIARHSSQLYRIEHGDGADLSDPPPRQHLDDFYLRRLRLHALHLAAIEVVAEGVLDELVIAVEDSRVESVSTSEREWLESWIRRLNLGDRVRCYPGADEVASTMLAGVVARLHGRRTRARVIVDSSDALERVAAFEDVPVRETLRRQCATAGVELVERDEDFVLAIHPPAQPAWDWFRKARTSEAPFGREASEGLVSRLAVEAGKPLVLADIAYSNGGDPELVSALIASGMLTRLTGYAGWNTAGNTLGTALAVGVLAVLNPRVDDSRERFLVHRLVEDVGYQSLTRRGFLNDDDPSDPQERIATGLAEFLRSLPDAGLRWRLVDGSVRLPWGRPFEVDFALERSSERTHE